MKRFILATLAALLLAGPALAREVPAVIGPTGTTLARWAGTVEANDFTNPVRSCLSMILTVPTSSGATVRLYEAEETDSTWANIVSGTLLATVDEESAAITVVPNTGFVAFTILTGTTEPRALVEVELTCINTSASTRGETM